MTDLELHAKTDRELLLLTAQSVNALNEKVDNLPCKNGTGCLTDNPSLNNKQRIGVGGAIALIAYAFIELGMWLKGK